jgi:hypothetical protein
MEIERHLSAEEFVALVVGSDSQGAGKNTRVIREGAAVHIERCAQCREEYAGTQKTLTSLPEAVRVATGQPYFFWQRQQAAIRSRIAIEEASHRDWRGFVWAMVASLILLATLLLNGVRTSPKPQIQVQTDADQELLLAVEQAVESGVPESLAPAALLAEDIRSAVEPASATTRNSKESRNEN